MATSVNQVLKQRKWMCSAWLTATRSRLIIENIGYACRSSLCSQRQILFFYIMILLKQ
jgi:hypothetical protein